MSASDDQIDVVKWANDYMLRRIDEVNADFIEVIEAQEAKNAAANDEPTSDDEKPVELVTDGFGHYDIQATIDLFVKNATNR